MKRSIITKRMFLWTAVLCWMAVIYLYSAQNADVSTQASGGISLLLARYITGDFDALSPEVQTLLVTEASFFVRKCAHLCEFAVLGVLILSLLRQYPVRLPAAAPIAWILTVLYAATDEFHQRFVPGRSCELRDVMVDGSGAMLGIVICVICVLLMSVPERGDRHE